MQGVGVVAGNQPRGLHQANEASSPASPSAALTRRSTSPRKGPCTAGTGTADFFMIVGDQYCPLAAIACQQGLEPMKHDKRLSRRALASSSPSTRRARRLNVVKRQLEVDHLDALDSMLLRQPVSQQPIQIGMLAALQEDWRHIGLGVHRLPIVGLAIEVYRQARDDRQRPVDIEQQTFEPTIGMAHVYASCQAQVAIEPGASKAPP